MYGATAGKLRTMPPLLIVMSGLPGAGKSTIAERIGRANKWPVLSVDPIESSILQAGVQQSFETGLAAYVIAQTLARENLRLGLSVIVDAVNSLEVGREMWRSVAHETGARIRVIECVCRDTSLHRARVEARRRDLPGFEVLSWATVETRRNEFEPWNEPRIILDTSEAVDYASLLTVLHDASN